MHLVEGTRIGDRYVLASRLGSGGMADVWLARDEMLGRPVALKFLHERFAQDAQFVERFRREARAAAGLQHANVVAVYDRGEADGRHWIAMEYVEGASLKELISRGLTVSEAIELIRQVLAGARFAHSHGVIHRDLKPQNVLVDGEGRARVTDFGIARAGASEITQTGSVLGTAQYLSPEQAQGLEVTQVADLYSIGVMLYEALTGRVPFAAETAVAVALKQVSEQPRPPSEINPNVTPALDAVVLRALAKDPANRFASAEEFLRALDAAEADPTGAALGDTAAYAPVAGAAGGAAGAAAAESAAAPDETEQPPPRRRGWMTPRRAAVLAFLALIGCGLAAWALTRPETAEVPGVIERPLTEARLLLARRGFDVATRGVESCDRPDTVIEQDPPDGSSVDEGTLVTLTISLGQMVTVPPLGGRPLDLARKRLDRANLNLAATHGRASRDFGAGRVISSRPASGTDVRCQSNVRLIVSKGPNLVSLPDVLGDQQEVAEARLERLGFIVNVDSRDADDPEGTVIGENPGPGSSLRRGTEVTIVVSTGAGSIVVPSVVGQSEAAARSVLASRGLSVTVVSQETDEAGEDGRVLEQAPPTGTRARAGDEVTIVVGELVEQTEPEPTTSTTSTTTTSTSTGTLPEPGP
jgi:eukaryotic-like serine/threonine-protein kinase